MQFPAALPFIFAGSKVAVTLAVIGAVIGEFVGSVAGLGNVLLAANSQLDSPLAWAALVWLSVLGILIRSQWSLWSSVARHSVVRRGAFVSVFGPASPTRKTHAARFLPI